MPRIMYRNIPQKRLNSFFIHPIRGSCRYLLFFQAVNQTWKTKRSAGELVTHDLRRGETFTWSWSTASWPAPSQISPSAPTGSSTGKYSQLGFLCRLHRMLPFTWNYSTSSDPTKELVFSWGTLMLWHSVKATFNLFFYNNLICRGWKKKKRLFLCVHLHVPTANVRPREPGLGEVIQTIKTVQAQQAFRVSLVQYIVKWNEMKWKNLFASYCT